MQRFIRRGILFIFAFIGLNALLYFGVVESVFYSRYIYLQQDISQYGKVLISDSHGAFLGSSPESIGIYNFSFHSETMADFYYKTLFAVEKLEKGDTIILAVDPHVLSSYRTVGKQESTIGYSPTFDATLGEYSWIEFAYKRLSRRLPLTDPSLSELLYIGMRTRWFGEKTKKNAWSSLEPEEQEKKVKFRFQEQFGNRYQSSDMVHIFRKIHALCKSRSIQLIGIRFPLTEEYQEAIGKKDFGMRALCRSMGISFWDFTEIMRDSGQYFSDQDHLNEEGTQVFLRYWDESIRFPKAHNERYIDHSLKGQGEEQTRQ